MIETEQTRGGKKSWRKAAPGTCIKVNAVYEVYAFLLGRAGICPTASPSLPDSSRSRKCRQECEQASDRGQDARTLFLPPSLWLSQIPLSPSRRQSLRAMRDADKCLVGGSPGASLRSYFPTPISITCAVWTTGATSLWKQLWEKGSVGDLEVLERKGTKKWSPRNLPVFLILAIHFSLATWSRPM